MTKYKLSIVFSKFNKNIEKKTQCRIWKIVKGKIKNRTIRNGNYFPYHNPPLSCEQIFNDKKLMNAKEFGERQHHHQLVLLFDWRALDEIIASMIENREQIILLPRLQLIV